ncbi:MAG: nucleotidyl transferase AbiEii/AbiGii toxin family protein [Chlorobi bacterium]|nr:nucleotidyl transferase AbiEii/AbiGii toxin family protein [Chlorobiota bacterium]
MLYKNTIEASSLELLKKLQSDKVFQNFHLAGGTSLALQTGHRKSVDLDLFSLTDFNVNFLLEHLENVYNFKMNYSATNTLSGSIHTTKIDFISHKYPLVDSVFKEENVRLYSVKDIAAMKLNAIAGNGTRIKDFIDVFFILKTYSIEEVLSFYKIKYNSRNTFHILKSLVYFEDVDLSNWPEMILRENISFEEIKHLISSRVKQYSQKF